MPPLPHYQLMKRNSPLSLGIVFNTFNVLLQLEDFVRRNVAHIDFTDCPLDAVGDLHNGGRFPSLAAIDDHLLLWSTCYELTANWGHHEDSGVEILNTNSRTGECYICCLRYVGVARDYWARGRRRWRRVVVATNNLQPAATLCKVLESWSWGKSRSVGWYWVCVYWDVIIHNY